MVVINKGKRHKSRAFGPALVAFALNYHHSAARFTLALTESGAAEYPPTKGNATTVGADGFCVWPVAFPA